MVDLEEGRARLAGGSSVRPSLPLDDEQRRQLEQQQQAPQGCSKLCGLFANRKPAGCFRRCPIVLI